jgi:hypothetical protein
MDCSEFQMAEQGAKAGSLLRVGKPSALHGRHRISKVIAFIDGRTHFIEPQG